MTVFSTYSLCERTKTFISVACGAGERAANSLLGLLGEGEKRRVARCNELNSGSSVQTPGPPTPGVPWGPRARSITAGGPRQNHHRLGAGRSGQRSVLAGRQACRWQAQIRPAVSGASSPPAATLLPGRAGSEPEWAWPPNPAKPHGHRFGARSRPFRRRGRREIRALSPPTRSQAGS